MSWLIDVKSPHSDPKSIIRCQTPQLHCAHLAQERRRCANLQLAESRKFGDMAQSDDRDLPNQMVKFCSAGVKRAGRNEPKSWVHFSVITIVCSLRYGNR